MTRVVLDANIFVSAVLKSHSKPATIFKLDHQGNFFELFLAGNGEQLPYFLLLNRLLLRLFLPIFGKSETKGRGNKSQNKQTCNKG